MFWWLHMFPVIVRADTRRAERPKHLTTMCVWMRPGLHRGTMDINPDRKRDWGRRLDVFWEGDGVYYRGTVTGYSTTSGKHTVMYDDGDVERVKLTEVGGVGPRSLE